ncbi:MAG: glycosyltransferase family 2 protein [Syntrophomonas sp.]|nr:glycosyltransferase family 2 protein [Syntrophomonas sp.]
MKDENSSPYTLSIIIPTYNEKKNVLHVAEQIRSILTNYELIFVDDSNDNTPEFLEYLTTIDLRVKYEHRQNERGLGTAVVRGFELATCDIIAVLDADLQHPPETLVTMLKAIEDGADIVIPSRFISGGNDGGLNPARKIISATARYLGKAFLSKLRPISDATSGFFMFRKEVIQGIGLKPIGWKILIEILARGKYHQVTEIPYHFQARAAGDSKMSGKEQLNYLRHLFLLLKDSPEDRRFYCFALVGLSGVFVNMFIYYILTTFRVEVRTAGLISGFAAMLLNFVLNDKITWANVKNNAIWIRGMKYIITSLIGIGINVSVLGLLYYKLQFHHLTANFIGILSAVAWNYSINCIWTWRSNRENPKAVVVRWPARI